MAEGTSKRDRVGARAKTRASAWLAWSLAGLTLAMFVATIPLWFLARSADLPSSWRADVGVGGLVGGAFFLAFPLIGALIASKRPKNAVGWVDCATARASAHKPTLTRRSSSLAAAGRMTVRPQ